MEEVKDNVVTKQETTEVLDANGNTLNSSASPLADIFNKIEEGKSEGKTAKEVIAELPAKKDEVVVEKKEVKAEKPAEKDSLEKRLDKVETDRQEKKEEEVTRESLRASGEKKEVKEVKEEKPEDVIPEEELQVLPQDKPKTAKRITALLAKIRATESKAAETAKQAEEKAAKLAELEKKLSETKTVDPATEEKVKKQLDELAMYRRRYDLDKDPEVKTKFDTRVELAEKSIKETLARNKAGESLIKLIETEGGWSKFSESNRYVTIGDGEGGTKQVTQAELADQILQALPLSERKGVEAAMVEQIQTKRDKDRFLQEEQAKAGEFFKKKEEETIAQETTYKKEVEEAQKKIAEWRDKFLDSDWIKDKQVPAGATAEQKAEIEATNAYNAKLRALTVKSLSAKKLEDLLEMAGDSVRYYDENRRSRALQAENERLKSELSKLRSAGRSVPKHGSISVSSSSSEGVAPKKPRSLEEAFAAIERGESVDGKDE